MRGPGCRFSRRTLLLCAFLSIAATEAARAGEGRWTPVGPGGGGVSSLATDPNSPGTLWAGTESGVYKSTDGGSTWTWKTGGTKRFSSVAVDPDHPSIVYAGVGKILRSEDGGETWSVALGSDTYFGPSLAVAPGSGTVYAAVDGVLRSADGGKSWQKVLDQGVGRIVFEPSNPRTVYALGAPGIWKSTDGGDNWARMGPPLRGRLELAYLQSIAVAPSQPGTLYVATGDGGAGYIYRSTDGGASWIEGGLIPFPAVSALIVDPETPTTVYASGGYGLVVSTDGGEHWVEKKNGLSGDYALTLAYGPGTPRILYAGLSSWGVAQTQDAGEHWRIELQLGLSAGGRLIEIDPVRAGTFYVSAAGRTFRTTDGGRTWTPFTDDLSHNGYVHDLAVDPFHPATVHAGTSFGIFRSIDDGASWAKIADQPSTILAVAAGGNEILSTYACGLHRSTDGGRTWQEVIPCFTGDGLLVSPQELLALPGRPTVHVAVRLGILSTEERWYLYTSRSNGRLWRRGIKALDVAVCLAHPETVYAAGYGSIRRSDDGGRRWTAFDAGLSPLHVAVDPRNPQIVYAGGTTVRRSADGGLTWSDAGEGLSGKLTSGAKLFADPTTPGHFFVQDVYKGGLFEATFPSP